MTIIKEHKDGIFKAFLKNLNFIFLLILSLFLLSCKKENIISGDPDANKKFISSLKILIDNDAGRPSWHPTEPHTLVYDIYNPSTGYWEIHRSDTNGNAECLTCGVPGLPQKTSGNPQYDHTGEYIVFQVEDPDHALNLPYAAHPGIGLFSNVWAMKLQDRSVYKLTQIPAYTNADLAAGNPVQAVLHPHLSEDRSQLLWSQRVDQGGTWGQWQVNLSEVNWTGGTPALAGTQILFKGGPPNSGYLMEAMGFRPHHPDQILMIGNQEPGQHEYGMDLYLFSVSSATYQNITNTMDYWEEGAGFSPSGRYLIFMSNKVSSPYDITQPWEEQQRTREYYIADLEAPEKGYKRLTFFNDPSAYEYMGMPVQTTKIAIHPNCKTIAALLTRDANPETDTFENQLVLVIFELRDTIDEIGAELFGN